LAQATEGRHMLKEQAFDTGEVTLNYAEGPASGPPLVLLHGFTRRWQDFLPLVPVLSLRWHVYAPDLRGHGKSGRVPGRYEAGDFVSDVAAFLSGVVKVPAVLFGHSLGAQFALEIAAWEPDAVRAVIVGDIPLSTETWAAQPTHLEYLARMRELAGWEGSIRGLADILAKVPVPGLEPATIFGEWPAMISVELREWARDLSRLDPDVLELHAEGRRDEFMAAFDFENTLRAISCPVLLLQGEPSRGGMMTDADVEYALDRLPEAYHVQIANVDHGLGIDLWEVAPVLRAVVAFLESL
jgi:pimeloyl-ACP methyl ester carboxylesterase